MLRFGDVFGVDGSRRDGTSGLVVVRLPLNHLVLNGGYHGIMVPRFDTGGPMMKIYPMWEDGTCPFCVPPRHVQTDFPIFRGMIL